MFRRDELNVEEIFVAINYSDSSVSGTEVRRGTTEIRGGRCIMEIIIESVTTSE